MVTVLRPQSKLLLPTISKCMIFNLVQGVYMNVDALGADGHFITSPEIRNMQSLISLSPSQTCFPKLAFRELKVRFVRSNFQFPKFKLTCLTMTPLVSVKNWFMADIKQAFEPYKWCDKIVKIVFSIMFITLACLVRCSVNVWGFGCSTSGSRWVGPALFRLWSSGLARAH